MMYLAPVLPPHCAIELRRKRVEVNPPDDLLRGVQILGRTVRVDARNSERQVRFGSYNIFDTIGCSALPVRADEKVTALRCPILLADVRKLLSARIVQCIEPEALTKVWDLEDDGLRIEVVKDASTIKNVMAWAANDAFFRVHVAIQHRDPPETNRHATFNHRVVERGQLFCPLGAIGRINQRPPPDVSHACHGLDVLRRYGRAFRQAENFGWELCW